MVLPIISTLITTSCKMHAGAFHDTGLHCEKSFLAKKSLIVSFLSFLAHRISLTSNGIARVRLSRVLGKSIMKVSLKYHQGVIRICFVHPFGSPSMPAPWALDAQAVGTRCSRRGDRMPTPRASRRYKIRGEMIL